jgi:MFS family permease
LVAVSGLGVMGLALAMVNDTLSGMPEIERRNAARIMAAERTGWSIGIILGPAAAAAIVTAAGGTHPVFIGAALVQLISGILVIFVPKIASARPASPVTTSKTGVVKSQSHIGKAALAVLIAGLVLVMLPSQTRTMYLPLFVTQVLREAAGTVGPLFTLNACVAVITMPYVGALADRFGAQRVLYGSALVGVVYCMAQSIATSYTQTLLIQMMIGFGIALWSTSALIYLQRLLPGQAGMAGGIYIASHQFSPVLCGLLLGPVAEVYGVPTAFTATAVLSLVALVLIMFGHRLLAAPRAA